MAGYYNKRGGYAPNLNGLNFGNAQVVTRQQQFQTVGGMRKKHSGAKFMEVTRNGGKPVFTAWNYSKRMGLVKVLIAPYHGSRKVTSKTGREWSVWMAKIEGAGFSEHFPVLVDYSRRIAVIRKYGWVVKPSSPNGGYCGTFTKKSR